MQALAVIVEPAYSTAVPALEADAAFAVEARAAAAAAYNIAAASELETTTAPAGNLRVKGQRFFFKFYVLIPSANALQRCKSLFSGQCCQTPPLLRNFAVSCFYVHEPPPRPHPPTPTPLLPRMIAATESAGEMDTTLMQVPASPCMHTITSR